LPLVEPIKPARDRGVEVYADQYVLVNGVVAKDGATWTGTLGGRVLTPDRR